MKKNHESHKQVFNSIHKDLCIDVKEEEKN
jgi:hypothetical protein